jgi:hypothetical protein
MLSAWQWVEAPSSGVNTHRVTGTRDAVGHEGLELGPRLGSLAVADQGQGRAADERSQRPRGGRRHGVPPGVERGDAEPLADGGDPPLHLAGHQVLGHADDVLGPDVARHAEDLGPTHASM